MVIEIDAGHDFQNALQAFAVQNENSRFANA